MVSKSWDYRGVSFFIKIVRDIFHLIRGAGKSMDKDNGAAVGAFEKKPFACRTINTLLSLLKIAELYRKYYGHILLYPG